MKDTTKWVEELLSLCFVNSGSVFFLFIIVGLKNSFKGAPLHIQNGSTKRGLI